MQTEPKLTVVIPNFNGESFIEETLNSVLEQSYINWECIVVDDGSTDQSLSVVQSFCEKDNRFRLYHRNRLPKNANTCRNIGIEHAKGEYIFFLDNDDLLLPTCIESRVKEMKNGWNLLIHGTNTLLPNGEQQLFGKEIIDNDPIKNFLRFEIPWQTTSSTWRTSFLIEIGGFDEQFNRLQDPEIHTRALSHENVNLSYQYQTIDNLHREGIHSKNRNNKQWLEKIANSYSQYYQKFIPIFIHTKYKTDLQQGILKTISVLSTNSKLAKLDARYTHTFIDSIEEYKLFTRNHILNTKRVLNLNHKFPYFKGNAALNRLLLSKALGL